MHQTGLRLIETLQYVCEGYDEFMLFCSHLGDPKNAFLIYFPLAYFINEKLGLKLLWTAVVSEWLNALFKWILHGERPYWWVHENLVDVTLRQFRLTCETGPGSPSGHAMVTGAVLYLFVLFAYENEFKYMSFIRPFSQVVYLTTMVAICVSRCFIATHFPHQVIAGCLTGYLIAKVMYRIPFHRASLTSYSLCTVIGIGSVIAVYNVVALLGVNPAWSQALAVKWCAHKEWVHLDTTLFFALMRDAGCLLGLGLGLTLSKKLFKSRLVHFEEDDFEGALESECTSVGLKCICCLIVITTGLLQESIALQVSTYWWIYIQAFVKYVLLIVITIGVSNYVLNRVTVRIKLS